MNVRFSITIRQQNLIEAIPKEDWTPILYWMEGTADLAETTYALFQWEAQFTRALARLRAIPLQA